MSSIFEAAVLCLALNVGQEARGEPETGMYAVAKVTINGAHGDPARICNEVFRPHRYTWTTKLKRGEAMRLMQRPWFGEAVVVARNALATPDWHYNAMYFHVCEGKGAVYPWWAPYKIFAGKIGHHCFYLENENESTLASKQGRAQQRKH